MTPLRQRMLEDLQIRRYSPTTIRIYLRAVAEFARHFGKPPDQLGAEHIRLYQLFLIKEKRVSLPTYIQMVCALRFFYTHTLNQKVAIDRIPFPRGDKKLPMILSAGRSALTREDLIACGVRIMTQGNQAIAASVKAVRDTYAHLFKGGAPDELKSKIAPPEEMDALVRGEQYKQWLRDFMR